MNEINQKNYPNRLLLYMDLLGTEWIETKDPQKKHAVENIINLLNDMSNSDFVNSATKLIEVSDHGVKRSNPRPTISSFSDHIAISYEVNDCDLSNVFARIHFLTKIAEKIHKYSLELGILARGAITYGELLHKENIIIGKGLIEAVKLEEKTAIYPRVIASCSLISFCKDIVQPSINLPLIRDFDGLYYVDYLKSTYIYETKEGGIDLEGMLPEFLKTIKEYISENIDKFSDEGNLHHLAKWQWLAFKFDEALEYWKSMFSVLREPLAEIENFNLTSQGNMNEFYPRIAPWQTIEEKFKFSHQSSGNKLSDNKVEESKRAIKRD